MPSLEPKKQTESNFSFFVRILNWFSSLVQNGVNFYNWSSSKIREGVNWLFPGNMLSSENEANILMRRALAQKSLIDSISSGWVELPFLRKAVIVIGITFAVGLMGLLASAPVFFALFSLFLCISAHVLLVSHEHHRRRVAKLMAEDAIAQNKYLEESKRLFDESVKAVTEDAITQNKIFEAGSKLLDESVATVTEVTVKLDEHAGHMEEQVAVLTEETKVVHQNTEKITLIVSEANEVTKGLVEQEKKLGDVLDKSTTELTRATKSLNEATQSVEGISQTSKELSAAVQGFTSSETKYAEIVTRFGLFVDDRMKAHQKSEIVAEEFSDGLMEKLDDAEALLDKIIASMEEGQTFSMNHVR